METRANTKLGGRGIKSSNDSARFIANAVSLLVRYASLNDHTMTPLVQFSMCCDDGEEMRMHCSHDQSLANITRRTALTGDKFC